MPDSYRIYWDEVDQTWARATPDAHGDLIDTPPLELYRSGLLLDNVRLSYEKYAKIRCKKIFERAWFIAENVLPNLPAQVEEKMLECTDGICRLDFRDGVWSYCKNSAHFIIKAASCVWLCKNSRMYCYVEEPVDAKGI